MEQILNYILKEIEKRDTRNKEELFLLKKEAAEKFKTPVPSDVAILRYYRKQTKKKRARPEERILSFSKPLLLDLFQELFR